MRWTNTLVILVRKSRQRFNSRMYRCRMYRCECTGPNAFRKLGLLNFYFNTGLFSVCSNSQNFSLNSLPHYSISTIQNFTKAAMESGLSNEIDITAQRSSSSSLSSFESQGEQAAKDSSQIRELDPPSQKSTLTPFSFLENPRKRPLSWKATQKDPQNK